MKSLLLIFLCSQALAAPRLIGGEVVPSGESLSTVRIDGKGLCTGSKIGPRTFLLAAHCMMAGAKISMQSGNRVRISTHYDQTQMLTVDGVFPHPTYLREMEDRRARDVDLDGGALVSYDIGVFTVLEESEGIPVATLDMSSVRPGDQVVVGGYGCVESSARSTGVGTYKKGQTVVVNSASVPHDARLRDASMAGYYNFYSQGMRSNPETVSLCPGDSGGPVYRASNQAIVGVNSQYLFVDRTGVSFVNLHARISNISSWLTSLIK